jgi:hypothetical protein
MNLIVPAPSRLPQLRFGTSKAIALDVALLFLTP